MKNRIVAVLLLAVLTATTLLPANVSAEEGDVMETIGELSFDTYLGTEIRQSETVQVGDMTLFETLMLTTNSKVDDSVRLDVMSEGADVFARISYLENGISGSYISLSCGFGQIPAQTLRIEVTYRVSKNCVPTNSNKTFFIRMRGTVDTDHVILKPDQFVASPSEYTEWKTEVFDIQPNSDPIAARLFAYINPGAYIDIRELKILASRDSPENDEGKSIITCVGDSLTVGVGVPSEIRTANSYPGQLQTLMGEEYKVVNCGRSSSTTISDDSTYMNPSKNAVFYGKTGAYRKALGTKSDIVLIMIGTNDSVTVSAGNPDSVNEYYNALKSIVMAFKSQETNPRVYILTSPYRIEGTASAKNVEDAIVPTQKRLAEDLGLDLIDIFAATKQAGEKNGDIYSDKLHFKQEGYAIIAKTVYDFLSAAETATPETDPPVSETPVSETPASEAPVSEAPETSAQGSSPQSTAATPETAAPQTDSTNTETGKNVSGKPNIIPVIAAAAGCAVIAAAVILIVRKKKRSGR